MSAIAGIYRLDGGPVETSALERMAEILRHRGPDGAGIWRDGSTGLAHRALWTTPESLHEQQPGTSPDGSLAITADARIDNRYELISRLDLPGPAHRLTDSDLILAAYERWGERCPEFLLGDFAFAVWDERRKVMFCARDHSGVKPLYYYRSERLFAFATEIKALFCLPEVPRRLNEVRIADFLTSTLEDMAITFYRDILRLPPAHSLSVPPAGVTMRRHWSLDPTYELRLPNDEAYAEGLRHHFRQAVECRLRSAYRVGTTLSGGLDSSSIACMARRLLPTAESLSTFSCVFERYPSADERPFIKAVLAQGGFEPHFVAADQVSPLIDLEDIFYWEDELPYAPNLFLHWKMLEVAQQSNMRILLDGLDGDTTISHGIGYLNELLSRGRFITLLQERRALRPLLTRRVTRRLFGEVVWPYVPWPVRVTWHALRVHRQPDALATSLIDSDFAYRVGIAERLAVLEQQRSEPILTERVQHWRTIARGINSYLLEVVDHASAPFSVEPRYPFFDRRLIEFCLSLPGNQKLYRGWTRMVMRRAMDGILPPEIQWRRDKSNLSPAHTHGLLAFERVRLERLMAGRYQALEQYVDRVALGRVWERYAAHPTPADAMILWKSVTLALWLDHARVQL